MSIETKISAANCRAAPNFTRKNHFVPCFYSSLWAGKDGRLCEFSRPYDRVKPRRTHPEGTGYDPDLYTEHDLPRALQTYLEDTFLKRVDQRACDALQLMLANRMNEMGREHLCAWARFIMSMIQRSPLKMRELRQRWKAAYLDIDEALEKEYQQRRADTDPLTARECLDQASPETSARGLVRVLQRVMDLPQVGHTLVNMRWGVLTIPRVDFGFLTSDRPIIMTNGLNRPDSHIVLPIGPRKLFIAANEHATLQRVREAGVSELVMETNSKVAVQADRFVYGESDYALNFVERRLRRRE